MTSNEVHFVYFDANFTVPFPKLFSAVSLRMYKREGKLSNGAILSKLLSSLDLTCRLFSFVSFYAYLQGLCKVRTG